MDLNENNGKRSPIAFAVVITLLTAFVGILTVLPHRSGESASVAVSDKRLMGADEKQMLVSILDHLELEVPDLQLGVRQLRSRILDHPTWVVDKTTSTSTALVWTQTDGLVFSMRFFDTDSYTQLDTLLKLVEPNHASLRLRPGDMAINPD